MLTPTNLVILGAITLLFVIALLVELRILEVLKIHSDSTFVTFVYGFCTAAFIWYFIYFAIISTGASTYLIGANAERWTLGEFTKLGPKWNFYSNVPFSVGFGERSWFVDVDLIGVGPYGVLVIESKFSSMVTDLGAAKLDDRVLGAIAQVEGNAGRVRAVLGDLAPYVPIRPVITFWGHAVKGPETFVRRVNSDLSPIRIVHGAYSKEWRGLIASREIMTQELIQHVNAKIAAYIQTMEGKTSD